jgi:hypothetical protein
LKDRFRLGFGVAQERREMADRDISGPTSENDPTLFFEVAGSGRSNDSGKDSGKAPLNGQAQRRNAGREECERKQKCRPALRPPPERNVMPHPAPVAP